MAMKIPHNCGNNKQRLNFAMSIFKVIYNYLLIINHIQIIEKRIAKSINCTCYRNVVKIK